MDIAKLKHKITDKIKATESTAILEKINRFLNSQEPNEADIYQLNEEQQNTISEAREDIKKG